MLCEVTADDVVLMAISTTSQQVIKIMMFFRSSLSLKPVVLSGRPNLISRLDRRQPNPILNRILFILPASGS